MKLSIITINYNNRKGLQKTIDSVVSQTWHDYEWIIIDGGSTDGSKELIEKYQEHFVYWCSEPDKGVYNAMNKGIAKAKGEYLLFLNSGDKLHSDKVLEDTIGKGFHSDIVYGDLNLVYTSNSETVTYPNKLTMHYLLMCSIGHPASFIKTSLLKERGYCEKMKIVSDWYRFLEWFICGKTFIHIHYVISDFDTTGISSQNSEAIQKEKKIVYRELFDKHYLKWVEESIEMQKLYYVFNNDTVLRTMRIVRHGGKRLSLLRFVIKVINKSFSSQQ